jgi:acyl-CoA thioester hydrolase
MPEPIDIQGLAPQRAIPTEGVHRLRVRYTECDPMGFVHHAVFPTWLELGRTELLREAGVTYAQLEGAGVLLVVTKLELRYRLPARYDDEIEIRTRVTGGGRARIDHAYEVRRVAPSRAAGDLCADATSTIACIGRDGRPKPLPEWLTPKAHR